MENIYKKCTRCQEFFKLGGFDVMSGNGETLHSSLQVYDKKYDLCPKCTHQLWLFVENRGDVQTVKPHIAKIGAFREMAKELKEHHTSFRHVTMGNFVNVEAIDDFIKSKQEELLGEEKIEGE